MTLFLIVTNVASAVLLLMSIHFIKVTRWYREESRAIRAGERDNDNPMLRKYPHRFLRRTNK